MEIREGIHLHILLPLYWVKDFDSKIPRPALPFWPCLLYICWVLHLSVSPTALTTQSEDAVDPKCHSLPLVGPGSKGRNSWNFPRDSLVFYKWDLNMWSFHQWWDNEGLIFEIRVLWSNFLLEWGLGSPRLLRKHGWYLHPLHCKPQHEKWNWI